MTRNQSSAVSAQIAGNGLWNYFRGLLAMSDADELTALRQEVARLRERIAELESNRIVLIFENEALDKQRRADAIRLGALRPPDG
jgi:hypothetical protein